MSIYYNVKTDGGAAGDGVSDDTTEIQNAISACKTSKRTLFFPAGTYRITQPLTVDYNGFHFVGEGWLSSVIKVGTDNQIAALIVAGRYGAMEGIGFNGANLGVEGIVMKNAAETSIEWCDARNFKQNGLLFDPTFNGGTTGNNNTARVTGGSYNSNGNCGISVTLHGDNNVLRFEQVNCSSNASHGMLLKSEGASVDGGLFEGNGGYGIQISEPSDGGIYSTSHRLVFPWLEANTLGGVAGGAHSSRNLVQLKTGQGYSKLTPPSGGSGSFDLVQSVSNSSTMFTNGEYGVKIGSDADGGYIGAYSASGSYLTMTLYAQGGADVAVGTNLNLHAGKVLKIGATQVVGARQPAIANHASDATVNAILGALRAHGLIAS